MILDDKMIPLQSSACGLEGCKEYFWTVLTCPWRLKLRKENKAINFIFSLLFTEQIAWRHTYFLWWHVIFSFTFVWVTFLWRPALVQRVLILNNWNIICELKKSQDITKCSSKCCGDGLFPNMGRYKLSLLDQLIKIVSTLLLSNVKNYLRLTLLIKYYENCASFPGNKRN